MLFPTINQEFRKVFMQPMFQLGLSVNFTSLLYDDFRHICVSTMFSLTKNNIYEVGSRSECAFPVTFNPCKHKLSEESGSQFHKAYKARNLHFAKFFCVKLAGKHSTILWHFCVFAVSYNLFMLSMVYLC